MTSRRTPLALLAVSVLLSGCGPAKHLSVDLRSVSITVPRLITPAVALVPAPAVAPPVPLPPLPPVISQLPPAPDGASAPQAAAPRAVAPPAANACPTAAPLAVPAVTASLVVSTPPAPATYTQLVSGSYATPAGKGRLDGPVTQTVKALPSETSSVGQVVDAWSVSRTDAAKKSTSVEVYRLVHASASPVATSPGIYLVGLAWHDPVRGTLSFQASGSGLYVLPSPVSLSSSTGTQYAGSDTDASTLTTLSLVRNVTGKKRVDACGQLIDTYTVEMSGVLTTADTQRQIAWTQQVATSYGGIDVQDTIGLTSASGDFSWSETRSPTALPKVTR